MNYTQEEIKIGDITVPIINDNNILWYPIRYISEKILLRRTNILTKAKQIGVGFDNIHHWKIDYGIDTGGIQLVCCVNKQGMELLFKDFKTGGYNLEQKKGYNNLIKYFNFDISLLPEFEQQDIKVNENKINNIIKNYDIYIQDCINKVLSEKENKTMTWRYCSQCGRLFPLDKMFFNEDQCNNTLIHKCKECQGNNFVLDKESSKTYNKKKEQINTEKSKEINYINYKEHNTIAIYEEWKGDGFLGNIPKIINNREDILKIIKHYYDLGFIDKNNLTKGYLKEKFNLTLDKSIKITEVYEFIFGKECKYYPWKYPKKEVGKLTYNECKSVFDNYIKENNIIINNIFNFNYEEVIYKSRLRKNCNDTLGFVVKYYDYKYAGYKFKTVGQNYYKNKLHRDFDMKYFIEQDMKIKIDKIPLYITKMSLQRNVSSLYNVLYKGKYYNNLFEWINEIYPNKFIENDFVINPYRDEFDSDDEIHIDKILHNSFENVIYNQRNTDRTIQIKSMIPDWLVFTDNNCWFIEYFGLYVDRNNSNNKRIEEYKERADIKIDKYKKLKGYKSLFIYPNDLDDNFQGLKNKLKEII